LENFTPGQTYKCAVLSKTADALIVPRGEFRRARKKLLLFKSTELLTGEFVQNFIQKFTLLFKFLEMIPENRRN